MMKLLKLLFGRIDRYFFNRAWVQNESEFISRVGSQSLHLVKKNNLVFIVDSETLKVDRSPSKRSVWKILATASWSYRHIDTFKPFGIDSDLCIKYKVGKLVDKEIYLNSYGIQLILNRIERELQNGKK